ncbi:putative ribonuclease H-like domain, reverse transcriptase zinc-binding domain-containing protein [Senna tora]|uniref:Putative ribonuclease H-like domain, reverse transcriptase zinc-binding domain-containing protein n=1 Tax=Senna tora TaxID=362788 RepID=A0A834WTP9_9FABA|nr:putative ribonuclease H-like domain, reverse transcriptase zinc-binding domain-containing protein [Senna tora]
MGRVNPPTRINRHSWVDPATNSTGGGSIGGLIRDHRGTCIATFVLPLSYPNEPEILEAMSVAKGIEFALGRGVKHLEIEGDAKVVFICCCKMMRLLHC